MKSDSNQSASGRPHTNPYQSRVTLPRRDFIKLLKTGVAALALTPVGWPESEARADVAAGAAAPGDWNAFVPANKNLRPEWVKSLFERGEPRVYTKANNELRFIGMPVGGICCGTMYLSGDGRLWCWDIFNQKLAGILPRSVPWSEVHLSFAGSPTGEIRATDGAAYVKPHTPAESPAIAQGFAIRVKAGGPAEVRPLDAMGWSDVRFTGKYPMGTVEYADADAPVSVKLEAFSPFIPLNADDSGLPATVMEYTVTNKSGHPVEVEIAGWLQNACGFYSGKSSENRVNRPLRGREAAMVVSSIETATVPQASVRQDVVIEDFEHAHGYGTWTTEGTAFGGAPVSRAEIPAYQGDVGGEGGHVVNSHASAPGEGVAAKDGATGKLASPAFTIQRKFITFYVGGGANVEWVGVRLLVGGKIVRVSAGHDENKMRKEAWDVAEFEAQSGVIEIYDHGTGGWGNIGADYFVQTDTPSTEVPLAQRHDFGTMALALVSDPAHARVFSEVKASEHPGDIFQRMDARQSGALHEKVAVGASRPGPIGAIVSSFQLRPGAALTVSFVIAWHFPNSAIDLPDAAKGNYYAKKFSDAAAVASYVAGELPRLSGDTKLWRETWNNSTLPHWLLDRTFANTSTLATTTAHRFASGRFWGWEGVGCCEGTCTHVWHYAQAMGRIFPEIERDLRERVDFGVAFDEATGGIGNRGERTGPAMDGEAGRIIGVLREHQMSADDAFLRRVWPRVRKATEYLLHHDADGDGIIDGPQENTLDAAWYGEIPWISSLAIAAFRAGEEMAREMGDHEFAGICRERFEKGRAAIETKLFNGEYFIQLPERGHEKDLGTYQACDIDQVFGQAWAWQMGLGRVLDREKTVSALKALWKYNFSPDVGPFRALRPEGRPYALGGDAGLIMAANPRMVPNVFGGQGWQYGYFNECMSGFEHQAAAHMVAEGMLTEGLAVTRAIHDRYHASRRNPWNEIECSDHYARAMASYGTFVSICGFECHGPRGHIGFAPRLTPENFKCAFTTAEGWGTFSQERDAQKMGCEIRLRHGKLRVTSIALEAPEKLNSPVQVVSNQKSLTATMTRQGERVLVKLDQTTELKPGQKLEITLA